MRVVFLQDVLFEYFGPMYISAVLKKAGHQVDLVIPKHKTYLRELEGAQVLALSCMSSGHQWYLDRAKEVKKKLKIPVVMGGPHPTFFPEVIHSPYLDYICLGEGEQAMLDLVRALEKGGDTEHIPNIWTKNNQNPLRPLPNDLDEIPFADRALYDKYPFLRNLSTKKFLASRGCPHQCTFCYNHRIQEMYRGQGRFVRMRRTEKVIEEIQDVLSRTPCRTVRFSDDSFALSKSWFRQFVELYKQKIGLPWTFLLRADELDEETVRLAKDAGCHSAYFGIESGSERVRNGILQKNITDKDIYRIAGLLKKARIKFGTYNMVGAPTETLEEAFRTVQLNIDIKTDIPTCSIVQPYPRTKLFDYCRDRGLIQADFHPDDLPTMFEESAIRLENKRPLENLHKLFYLAVKFPFLFPLVKSLIHWPPNPLFKLIFFFSFGHRSFTAFHAGILESLRLGLSLRKTVYK
jgi:anaerobic magnesium-protoporphyrin IX monomethyl ester cyclase